MSKIYIFDVDGTLTPSRQKMTEEFKDFFKEWALRNTFYLVTGSDLPKLQEQMDGMEIHSSGIFTCCGNEFWQVDPAVHPKYADNIYSNKFKPADNLIKYLEDTLDNSDYPIKAGQHIEDRGSMLNFSMVGRKCTLQERKDYFEYDKLTGERESIAKYIRENWKDLDAVIGGQISIDIYPKGNDKSQILDIIKQDRLVEPSEYIFIGDRTEEGGNDYPLVKLMKETENCRPYQTDSWRRTKLRLQYLEDEDNPVYDVYKIKKQWGSK
tara:strand:- start:83 stop:883 length:801 start_codon:yes stop_codon:yes gene_type:complete